jgi:drug/metabolite transporter (DMT)-like permease
MDGGENLARSRGIGRGLAIAATLGAVSLWGFSPIGTRLLVGTADAALPVMPLLGLRYGAAALMLAPFLFRRKHFWTRQDWWRALWCGLSGITGYNLLATFGQRTVTAGMTGLLDAAEPLLILLFSAIAARRLPSRRVMMAACGGVFGVGLLASGAGPAEGDFKGIVLVLLGAGSWSLYCVMVPRLIIRRGTMSVSAITMLLGAAPMAALGASGMPATIHALTGPEALVLAALIFGSSTLAMVFWNIGNAAIGAVQAGWFLYMIPLVSVGGGALFLHETVTAPELAGGLVILLAVIAAQTGATKK